MKYFILWFPSSFIVLINFILIYYTIEAVARGATQRKSAAPRAYGSKTAPGPGQNSNRKPGVQNPRGVPATKTIGTVTRKVAGNSVPARRPPRFPQSNQVPETAPAVSVSGVKGIRSIRQTK